MVLYDLHVVIPNSLMILAPGLRWLGTFMCRDAEIYATSKIEKLYKIAALMV